MTNRPDLVPLALWLGHLRAGSLDVAGVVGDVCVALPDLLGIAGAAALAVDAQDPLGVLVASDGRARLLGDAQRRAARGPLLEALCRGHAPVTPDLTRIAPPVLAAAAAETGLVSSVVLPIGIGAERTGALQLLGDVARPVTGVHADAVRPVLRALAARLADVLALRAAGTPERRTVVRPPSPRRAPDDDLSSVATGRLPAFTPPADVTAQLRLVPSPRPR